MMRKSIRVFQNPSTSNRCDFLSSFEIPCSLDVTNMGEAQYWFIHINDKPGVGDDGFLEFHVAETTFNGWRIYFSGVDHGHETLIEDKRILIGLTWRTIEANFAHFINAIQAIRPVIESLNSLIGFDPLQEKKLRDFETCDPFSE